MTQVTVQFITVQVFMAAMGTRTMAMAIIIMAAVIDLTTRIIPTDQIVLTDQAFNLFPGRRQAWHVPPVRE